MRLLCGCEFRANYELFEILVSKGDGHDQTYYKCPNCGMVTTDFKAKGSRIVKWDDKIEINRTTAILTLNNAHNDTIVKEIKEHGDSLSLDAVLLDGWKGYNNFDNDQLEECFKDKEYEVLPDESYADKYLIKE